MRGTNGLVRLAAYGVIEATPIEHVRPESARSCRPNANEESRYQEVASSGGGLPVQLHPYHAVPKYSEKH